MLHTHRLAPRERLAAFACSLMLAACVSPEDAEIDDEDVGDSDDAVDEDELDDEFRAAYSVVNNQFALANDGSSASFATGSLAVPIRVNGQLDYEGGWLVRGTCGLTFISPHYAVTAAHCVTAANVPAGVNVSVKTYNITAMQDWFFGFSAAFDGDFPNYEALVPVHMLPNYSEQAYECSVVARCGTGDPTCTDIAGDVAMLYCGGRASNAPWLPVAQSDPHTGDVEMYWFHELLQMPTSDTPPAPGTWERQQWDHYTQLTGDVSQNFHYLQTLATQLVPLKSIPWPNGVQRRRVGGNWTDMFGCHGTSGSGILQRNAQGNLELLGPVEFGAWASNRLCDDPATHSEGQFGISYTDNSYVRQLEQKFAFGLMLDRNPIVWQPWPPIWELEPG